MVSNPPLATLCVTSGMYEFVEAGPHHLGDSLKRFVEEVLARRDKEFELAAKENRSPGQYWLDIECPKVPFHLMLLACVYGRSESDCIRYHGGNSRSPLRV